MMAYLEKNVFLWQEVSDAIMCLLIASPDQNVEDICISLPCNSKPFWITLHLSSHYDLLDVEQLELHLRHLPIPCSVLSVCLGHHWFWSWSCRHSLYSFHWYLNGNLQALSLFDRQGKVVGISAVDVTL